MQPWIANLLMPILGTVTADLIWIVSITELLSARRSKTINHLDPLPYVAGLASCIAWLIYSVCISDYYVFASNFPGVVLMTFYCISILSILAKDDTSETIYLFVERLFIGMVAFFACFPLVVLLLGDADNVTQFIGLTATVINILFYMAPVTVIVNVFKTKNASSLFLPMLLANFTCSFCWMMYGLFGIDDVWIWSTNAVGVLLQGFFVVLRIWYGAGSQQRQSVPSSNDDMERNVTASLLKFKDSSS
jgi:uncharacterized protein with PQ loop repeat